MSSLNCKKLDQLLESVNTFEEDDREQMIQDLENNLVKLKKKIGNINTKEFIQNLEQLNIDTKQEEMKEDLWDQIRKYKNKIPFYIKAAFLIALLKASEESPDDVNEFIHYGEAIDHIVHAIAHLGPKAYEIIAQVL